MTKGVDSNKDVHPILTDTGGRQLIVITDAQGHTLDITSGNKALTSIYGLYPDNTNQMPSMDNVARPGFQKITDGTNTAILDTDDGVIAKEQTTLVVINLNYVWDAGNTQWVPMTQPS